MGVFANVRETLRVVSDVARALPVLLAKLPESNDPASIAMVLE